MFDGRSNLSQQVLQEIKKHFGTKVYNTFIPRNVRLAEAPGFGRPALVHDRQSSGAQAYLQLAQEFLKRRGLALDVPAEPSSPPGPSEPMEETTPSSPALAGATPSEKVRRIFT